MDVMLPKRNINFFVIVFGRLRLFSLCLICSLELSNYGFSMWSSPNCGRICGQNTSRPKLVFFHQPRTGSVLRFRLIGL